MQRKLVIGLLAGSVVLSGCVARHSEAPIATNFAAQKQLKMQSASHWQLIARDAAAQLIAALPEKHPLHVRQSDTQSPFEKAFTGQLIGELNRAGYPVMKTEGRSDTLLVEVSATPLLFSRNRLQGKPVGRWSMLTAGLWVLREIYEDSSLTGATMATAVTLDALEWFHSESASGPTPRTELIVTTSISNAERYYAQVSSTYYTTDSDWNLYSGSGSAIALPVKGKGKGDE